MIVVIQKDLLAGKLLQHVQLIVPSPQTLDCLCAVAKTLNKQTRVLNWLLLSKLDPLFRKSWLSLKLKSLSNEISVVFRAASGRHVAGS